MSITITITVLFSTSLLFKIKQFFARVKTLKKKKKYILVYYNIISHVLIQLFLSMQFCKSHIPTYPNADYRVQMACSSVHFQSRN